MIRTIRNYWLPTILILILLPPLSAQTSSPAHARYPISENELKSSLEDIDKLIRQGALLEAKTRYQTLIQYDLSDRDHAAIQQALEGLNMKILFSPVPTPASFSYRVKQGDSLSKIAKENHTTIELIQKSNHLSGDLIRPGMKLKISKAVYSVVVDKSKNILKLFSDQELLKTYPVATGKEDRTPIGTYTVTTKLVDPVWYKAGAVFPPASPDNILGTRWLGFSLPSYGIHGTTLPETIGTNATEGCVRMYNQDVEELSAIVPIGITVTIVD